MTLNQAIRELMAVWSKPYPYPPRIQAELDKIRARRDKAHPPREWAIPIVRKP